ncbi:TetR/AcrR family transcriptional regulator [Dactylosporangium sp. NPDC051541]|uniref:TetR/AcrR family transcriptional regulator n=1 Tax=Dactylosporangium sp. NPDC051541 TaxID=3363977 RepID=UPI0037B6D1DD
MGHREDLLDGAVRCIYEKGYARTTARDVVEASGTNLGSIGYHYGGMTNLMAAALEKAVEAWGLSLAQAIMSAGAEELSGVERFERYWEHMINSVHTQRPLLMATFDAFLEAEKSEAVKTMLIEGMRDARRLWAQVFHGIDAAIEPAKADLVGSFYQALVSGVLTQVLLDPDDAPTAQDLTAAVNIVAESFREKIR